MAIWIALLALLLTGVVAACGPAGAGSPSPSDRSGPPSAPVAPAVETDHPDAERTLQPISPAPVAPAVETDHPDAEEPLPLPSTEAP